MASEEKPKIFEGGRDMVLSLAVVVVMMLVTVGATGLCSINPEESNYARVNEVDAATFLDLESRATTVPLRNPQMPEGWTPNSARRSTIDGNIVAVVGWVTAQQGFVQSTQTDLALVDALKKYDGHYRPDERHVQVENYDVTVLSSDEANVRDVWGVDLGDSRVVLSGSAADADFISAIEAFAKAPVIINS